MLFKNDILSFSLSASTVQKNLLEAAFNLEKASRILGGSLGDLITPTPRSDLTSSSLGKSLWVPLQGSSRLQQGGPAGR